MKLFFTSLLFASSFAWADSTTNIHSHCQNEAKQTAAICAPNCVSIPSCQCIYIASELDPSGQLSEQEKRDKIYIARTNQNSKLCLAKACSHYCGSCKNIYLLRESKEYSEKTCTRLYALLNEKNRTCKGCLRVSFDKKDILSLIEPDSRN